MPRDESKYDDESKGGESKGGESKGDDVDCRIPSGFDTLSSFFLRRSSLGIDVTDIIISPNDCDFNEPLRLEIEFDTVREIRDAHWRIGYLVDTVGAKRHVASHRRLSRIQV